MANKINYLEFWRQAIQQEIGLFVRTNNPTAFRNNLYAARQESGELSFSTLVCFAPAPGLVLIVKQSVELDP